MPERRLSREEIGERGLEVYEKLRLHLESDYHGQFVAIDVETEEYEIASEVAAATDQLWSRIPGAQVLVERIGYSAAFVARTVRLPS